MAEDEEVSVNTNAIQENARNSSDAFENFQRQSTDDELIKFHREAQKEKYLQEKWEFWFFRLIFKAIVLLAALCFMWSSASWLDYLFSLINKENEDFFKNWHLPVVIIISLVSAIVAMFAILLRGLSQNIKSSQVEDVPLPVLARVLVELSKIISSRNH